MSTTEPTSKERAKQALDSTKDDMEQFDSRAPELIQRAREFHSKACNALKDNVPSDLANYLAHYGADAKLENFLACVEKIPKDVDYPSQRYQHTFIQLEFDQLAARPDPNPTKDNDSYDAIWKLATTINEDLSINIGFLNELDEKLDKWEQKLQYILHKFTEARLWKRSRIPEICDDLHTFIASVYVPVHPWKPRPQDDPRFRDGIQISPAG
ncbi:hypothetical protein B0T22DRAFT_310161 [Podospora appendiculata]|uniref:Uncharacterized protein n=1 Tax=Podospora appendiculata TaxID=314037 RepID=A0AAE1C761_9PEZI|nr:hypothetical protein B0T22DRAFT_310161 [Podospora appendiculata]